MADRPVNLRSISVLLVDDESFVRAMLKQILRNLGVNDIREASEGAAGLKELETVQPDVVICDLNMEPMNGLVFVQMMRAHQNPAIRDLPVIVLTGQTDIATVKAAAKRGIHAYLAKPVSMAALKARLESVLGNPRTLAVQEGRSTGEDG